MTADNASPAALGHLEKNRNRPSTEVRCGTPHQAFLIGTVHVVANHAGTPFFPLIDMDFVQITVTVAKVGQPGATVFDEPLRVAAKTEGITVRTVGGVNAQREFCIEERLKGSAVRVVTGHALTILDRLMLRLGVGNLRLDVIMTIETERPLRLQQHFHLSGAVRIMTGGTAAIGDGAVF